MSVISFQFLCAFEAVCMSLKRERERERERESFFYNVHTNIAVSRVVLVSKSTTQFFSTVNAYLCLWEFWYA